MTGPVGSRHDWRRGAGGPGAHAKTRAGPAGAPGGRVVAALPTGFGVVIDPGTKQLDRVTLFGGAPARVLRLSRAGRTALAELRAGPVRGAAAGRLARKLTDAGLAHPRPPELASRPDVTVLIPARDSRSTRVGAPPNKVSELSCLVPGSMTTPKPAGSAAAVGPPGPPAGAPGTSADPAPVIARVPGPPAPRLRS